MADEKFVNPYTFIGLGSKKSEGKGKGLHTGVLSCTLRTLTPLIIPNTGNEKAFPKMAKKHVDDWNGDKPPKDHVNLEKVRSYDFYSYDNPKGDRENIVTSSPVIPGSSIRGMVRSVYETLTNSCLSSIDEDMLLNKRSVIPYTRSQNDMGAGIVEKVGDKWFLYSAEKIMVNITKGNTRFNRETNRREPHEHTFGTPYDKNALTAWSKVYVKRTHNKFKPHIAHYGALDILETNPSNKDYAVGYYLKGESFTRKHHDAIMVKQGEQGIELEPSDIKRAKKVAELYDGYNGWIKSNPMPVYYEKVGASYYISPACISQEVFERKVGDMIGDFAPCDDSHNVCDACNLFGMVGKSQEENRSENKVNAKASRISFRDATAVATGNWYDEPKQLAILGQPRPSATEFYMAMPSDGEPDFWNYDYVVHHKGEKNKKTMLSANAVTIKGRKFYWHSDYKKTGHDNSGRPDLSIIARAVSAEQCFKFDVAFENVTNDELAKLIWVLTIGDKAAGEKPSHGHKLGHGKPIGFGSVGITIGYDKSCVFVNDSYNIVTKPLNCIELPPNAEETLDTKGFGIVSNWAGKHENVMYPKYGGKGDIFAWFGANRKGLGNHFNLKFINQLPVLSDAPGSQEMSLTPSPNNGNISTASQSNNQRSYGHSAGRDSQQHNQGHRQTNRSNSSTSKVEKESPMFTTSKESSGNSAFSKLNALKFDTSTNIPKNKK